MKEATETLLLVSLLCFIVTYLIMVARNEDGRALPRLELHNSHVQKLHRESPSRVPKVAQKYDTCFPTTSPLHTITIHDPLATKLLLLLVPRQSLLNPFCYQPFK